MRQLKRIPTWGDVVRHILEMQRLRLMLFWLRIKIAWVKARRAARAKIGGARRLPRIAK